MKNQARHFASDSLRWLKVPGNKLKTLSILMLLYTPFIFCEDKPKEPKPEEPAEVLLTRDQETQLDLITSQFREAVAVEEAAKAKKESAQLKYTLAVTQFRAALKVGDEYQFEEASKKFVRKKEQGATKGKP